MGDSETMKAFLLFSLASGTSVRIQKIRLNNGHSCELTSGSYRWGYSSSKTCSCLEPNTNGETYRGNEKFTALHPTYGRRPCKPWSQTRYRDLNENWKYGLNGNECRNPDGLRSKPWCVVEDGYPGPKIGFCDIELCEGEEYQYLVPINKAPMSSVVYPSPTPSAVPQRNNNQLSDLTKSLNNIWGSGLEGTDDTTLQPATIKTSHKCRSDYRTGKFICTVEKCVSDSKTGNIECEAPKEIQVNDIEQLKTQLMDTDPQTTEKWYTGTPAPEVLMVTELQDLTTKPGRVIDRVIDRDYISSDIETNSHICNESTCNCLQTDTNGSNYSGHVSKTKSHPRYGVRPCKQWSQTRFMPIDGNNHNYCRNPTGSRPQPWCVIADGYPGPKIGYCDIEECPTVSSELPLVSTELPNESWYDDTNNQDSFYAAGDTDYSVMTFYN